MGSKRVRTYDLTPGLIAADDVYTFNDQLIIQEGTRVTDRVITRLKFYAVPDIKVYTDEDTDEDELPPEEETVIFSYDKQYFAIRQGTSGHFYTYKTAAPEEVKFLYDLVPE